MQAALPQNAGTLRRVAGALAAALLVLVPAVAHAGDPWGPTVAAFCSGDGDHAVEVRRTVQLEMARVGTTFQGALRTRAGGEVLREFQGESCEGVVGALRVAADLAEPPEAVAAAAPPPDQPPADVNVAPRRFPEPVRPVVSVVPFVGVGLWVAATARPLATASFSVELGVGAQSGRKRAEVRLEGGGAIPRVAAVGATEFRSFSGAISALASIDVTSRVTVGAGPFAAVDGVRARARGEAAQWASAGRLGGRTEIRWWLMPRFALSADFRLGGGVGRDRFFLNQGGEVARTPALGWSLGVGVSWVFPKTEMAGGRRRHEPVNSL